MKQSELSEYQSDGDASYKDPETLRRLYWDEGLAQSEIADRYDVVFQTISRHMVEHGINPGKETGQFERVERAGFLTDDRGYERWSATDTERGREEYVKVHRLLAVAEFGFDAVCDMDVHHGVESHLPACEIPWANWGENIEVIERGQHMTHHAENRTFNDETRRKQRENAKQRERNENGEFI